MKARNHVFGETKLIFRQQPDAFDALFSQVSAAQKNEIQPDSFADEIAKFEQVMQTSLEANTSSLEEIMAPKLEQLLNNLGVALTTQIFLSEDFRAEMQRIFDYTISQNSQLKGFADQFESYWTKVQTAANLIETAAMNSSLTALSSDGEHGFVPQIEGFSPAFLTAQVNLARKQFLDIREQAKQFLNLRETPTLAEITADYQYFLDQATVAYAKAPHAKHLADIAQFEAILNFLADKAEHLEVYFYSLKLHKEGRFVDKGLLAQVRSFLNGMKNGSILEKALYYAFAGAAITVFTINSAQAGVPKTPAANHSSDMGFDKTNSADANSATDKCDTPNSDSKLTVNSGPDLSRVAANRVSGQGYAHQLFAHLQSQNPDFDQQKVLVAWRNLAHHMRTAYTDNQGTTLLNNPAATQYKDFISAITDGRAYHPNKIPASVVFNFEKMPTNNVFSSLTKKLIAAFFGGQNLLKSSPEVSPAAARQAAATVTPKVAKSEKTNNFDLGSVNGDTKDLAQAQTNLNKNHAPATRQGNPLPPLAQKPVSRKDVEDLTSVLPKAQKVAQQPFELKTEVNNPEASKEAQKNIQKKLVPTRDRTPVPQTPEQKNTPAPKRYGGGKFTMKVERVGDRISFDTNSIGWESLNRHLLSELQLAFPKTKVTDLAGFAAFLMKKISWENIQKATGLQDGHELQLNLSGFTKKQLDELMKEYKLEQLSNRPLLVKYSVDRTHNGISYKADFWNNRKPLTDRQFNLAQAPLVEYLFPNLNKKQLAAFLKFLLEKKNQEILAHENDWVLKNKHKTVERTKAYGEIVVSIFKADALKKLLAEFLKSSK